MDDENKPPSITAEQPPKIEIEKPYKKYLPLLATILAFVAGRFNSKRKDETPFDPPNIRD